MGEITKGREMVKNGPNSVKLVSTDAGALPLQAGDNFRAVSGDEPHEKGGIVPRIYLF